MMVSIVTTVVYASSREAANPSWICFTEQGPWDQSTLRMATPGRWDVLSHVAPCMPPETVPARTTGTS